MPVQIRQTDSADRLPPAPRDGRPAPYARPTTDPGVVLFGGGLALLGAAILVPLFWWLFRDWIEYGSGKVWLSIVGGLGIAWLAGKVVRSWLFVSVRDIPIATTSLARTSAPQLLAALLEVDRTYAGAVVPAQITYSPTEQTRTDVRGAEPAQIAAPEPGLTLIPDTEWRRWIDRAPHLLIAGRTDAGKTTLMEAILNERAAAGDDILILDPHYQPGKWCGLPAIGGGNSFEAILAMLPRVITDMDARYKEFEAGRPMEDFQRLTVLIDEAPALVDYCIELTPSGRQKIKDFRWPKFAKRLGSEARKVRISVILGSQSTIVTDLLINSQMRENYLRIGLGDRARPLIHDEPSPKRRAQLDDLLRGQAHPAAMEWRGDFHLLDTSAVPDLAARRVPSAALWMPPEPPSVEPFRPSVASVRPSDTTSVSIRPPQAASQTSGRTDGRTDGDKTMAYLRAFVRAGKSREHARAVLSGRGIEFENKAWTEARRAERKL